MKLWMNTAEFKRITYNAYSALPNKALIDAYSMIKITATPTHVLMEGHDIDMSVIAGADAKVTVEGSYGVPGGLLYDLSQRLKSDTGVEIFREGNKIVVKCGQAKVKLPLVEGNIFPLIPSVIPVPEVLKPGFFKDLSRVAHCASKDEGRAYLTGVNFDDGVMVATDGFRLAFLKSDSCPKAPTKFTIKKDSLKKVEKLYDDKEPLGISVCSSEAHFTQKGTTATVRFLSGIYPNWRTLIPQAHYDEVTINKAALLYALTIVDITSEKTSKSAIFEFTPDKLVITASTDKSGEASYPLDIKSVVNYKMRLGLDYVQAAFQDMTTEDVTVEMRGTDKPIVLKEPGYVHIVMPQRV